MPVQPSPLISLHAFYNTPSGAAFQAQLGRVLLRIWPNLNALSLLGLGYAGPYLPIWEKQSAYSLLGWPIPDKNLQAPKNFQHYIAYPKSCLLGVSHSPFSDSSFDRILLIHTPLSRKNLFQLIKEGQRILKENGKMLIVLPNRYNYLGYTFPFHFEKKWGAFKSDQLLSAASLTVEQRYFACFLPISRMPRILYQTADYIGQFLFPFLCGLLLIEVTKTVYEPLVEKSSLFSRRMLTQNLIPLYNNREHNFRSPMDYVCESTSLLL